MHSECETECISMYRMTFQKSATEATRAKKNCKTGQQVKEYMVETLMLICNKLQIKFVVAPYEGMLVSVCNLFHRCAVYVNAVVAQRTRSSLSCSKRARFSWCSPRTVISLPTASRK